MRLVAICVTVPILCLAAPAPAQTLLDNLSKDQTPVYLSMMGEPVAGSRDGVAPFEIWFRRADSNRDDAISLLELIADSNRFFGTLDVDGNERIERPEMDRYEKEVAPPNVRLAGGMKVAYQDPKNRSALAAKRTGKVPRSTVNLALSTGKPDANAKADSFSIVGVPQPVAMADTDLNSIVTKKEFQSVTIKHFMALDQNKDQKLVREDFFE